MLSISKIAFFIPATPFLAACLILILLISFNRTVNRLSKPVTFIIVNSVVLPTLVAMFLSFKHLYGEVVNSSINLFGLHYLINLKLDSASEISIIFIGLISLLIMILSYVRLPRQKGYVRYFISLGFISSILFLVVLSNDFSYGFLSNF
ncbi:NADH-quinone oxidoreductase [Prochlorococcus marinus]|uniref:NADH-quinone oxidoreductase n=1 Tax=Prochlorococcus marinus TaxID=1219 RepID=UPI0022B53030|nr:NADH-quinone oxidoreductase [Prochlorococcus marinus]